MLGKDPKKGKLLLARAARVPYTGRDDDDCNSHAIDSIAPAIVRRSEDKKLREGAEFIVDSKVAVYSTVGQS